MFSLKPIFSGIQKFTTIDDDGYLGMILFTGGCNFRCHYCHNPQFVLEKEISFIEVEDIKEILEKRKNVLESVIICGGEPTIHENLVEWLRFIKSCDYRIKLDTNATNPKMLKRIIDEKLINFFAIDYKASITKYSQITQKVLNMENLKESIHLIVSSGIDYEFRTTIHSFLHSREDIEIMMDELRSFGVKRYFLQGYKHPKKTVGINLKEEERIDFVKEFEVLLKEKFEISGVRNV